VPDQLSLVGFDNDPESLAAGLTTVERPSAAVGEAAAQVALERIAGQEGNTVSVHLRPVLIERSSVVPLAQGDSVLTAEMPRAQRKASFKGPFSASSASLR
jgi:hypothetical protein